MRKESNKPGNQALKADNSDAVFFIFVGIGFFFSFAAERPPSP